MKIIVTIALISFFALASTAQCWDVQIDGTVSNMEKEFLPDVTILLFENEDTLRKAVTDSVGGYAFNVDFFAENQYSYAILYKDYYQKSILYAAEDSFRTRNYLLESLIVDGQEFHHSGNLFYKFNNINAIQSTEFEWLKSLMDARHELCLEFRQTINPKERLIVAEDRMENFRCELEQIEIDITRITFTDSIHELSDTRILEDERSRIEGSIISLEGNCANSVPELTNDQIRNLEFNLTVDGKKQGYWIYRGKDRPSDGYPAEGIIEEGPYVNNRKEGLWIKYYKDGKTPRLKGVYRNNRPIDSHYTKYYPTGKLREGGRFQSNKYFGSLRRYHENGQLSYFGTYNDSGQEFDSTYYYFESGCLESICVYDSINPDYTRIEYSPDSCNTISNIDNSLSKKSNYSFVVKERSGCTFGSETKYKYASDTTESNHLNPSFESGSWRYKSKYKAIYTDELMCDGENVIRKYTADQERLFLGNCKNGKVWEGMFYFYDSDGILLKVEVWKKGKYDANGQI